MKATLPLLCLSLLGACGPAEVGKPQFDVTLAATAGLIDLISGFQVALVKSGSSLDCAAVKKTCLNAQVDASRLVPLKSGQVTKNALFFDLKLVAGTPSTQDLSLQDLPLGRDYALVIEALSKEPTPRLAGSSCSYVKELTAGTNTAVLARVDQLTPYASCDPRIP
jgi:hypothetical protein